MSNLENQKSLGRANPIGGWPARFFMSPIFREGALKKPTDWIISWYSSRVVSKNFLGQVLRRARRTYLGTFNPQYIQQSIKENREGECHRCGLCCQLIYKCPMLGRDKEGFPYCRIYGDLRPTNCHAYPFDAIDAEIETCGFSIKGKPRTAPPAPKRVK